MVAAGLLASIDDICWLYIAATSGSNANISLSGLSATGRCIGSIIDVNLVIPDESFNSPAYI